MPKKTDVCDERQQREALADYVNKLLHRATSGTSQTSRSTAVRALCALTLAARFGGLPKMRDVGRVLARNVK